MGKFMEEHTDADNTQGKGDGGEYRCVMSKSNNPGDKTKAEAGEKEMPALSHLSR